MSEPLRLTKPQVLQKQSTSVDKDFGKKKRRKTAKSKHASKRNRQFIKKPFTHANCFPGQQHLKVSRKTNTRILK